MQHNKENNAQNKTIYSNGNANKTTHKTGQYNKQNAQNNSTWHNKHSIHKTCNKTKQHNIQNTTDIIAVQDYDVLYECLAKEICL